MPIAWIGELGSGFVGFFIKTRIGNILGLLMLASLGLWWWTHHVEAKAAKQATSQVVAQVTKATDGEHDRRLDVLLQAQADMKKSLDAVHQLEQLDATRLKEIDNASHANDGHACLDAGAVRRLQSIH